MRDMQPNGDTSVYDCGAAQSGFVVLMSHASWSVHSPIL